jgi:hypothetical protein
MMGSPGFRTAQHGGDEKNEKDNEEDLGDRGGRARNGAETEDTRNQGNEEKDDGVAQHGKPGVPHQPEDLPGGGTGGHAQPIQWTGTMSLWMTRPSPR